ncbi:MAG TPA: hypothetical protein VFW33_21845 [Gemmataceae bacterium]|nr:hypothetical protein [Gemmataceae bacterium]
MKATKAQVEARVTELLRIRLDGAEFWDIREYVREKEQEDGSLWRLAEDQKPLSDSQLWRYLARVNQAIAQSSRASRKKLIRQHQAQRRALYAKAVAQGDIRAALACKRDEAELLGLYPSADDELKRLAEALRKELAEVKEAKRESGNGKAAEGAGDPGERGRGDPPPDP